MTHRIRTWFLGAAVAFGLVGSVPAGAQPFDGKEFRGRIAWSADGNHNDPDDWAASPVALAIFASAGVRDRLVHFDYNCILPETNPEWEKIHAESVLGAAERYGYNRARFHDCRKDRAAAVGSIARAINASSAENPLYFVIAGPVEVPLLGIRKADPEKLRFVYCISHSQWNDGFAARYTFTHTKRSVIPTGVRWVQIQDQNRLLSKSRYGQPAAAAEFQPYFWMRDSNDPRVRFLWERIQISTRPDPSDAGMAYFLATGDEEADPAKLKLLLDDKRVPEPVEFRKRVRLEGENCRSLEGYQVEHGDRTASHRLAVKLAGPGMGRVRADFDEPYAAAEGRYDVDVRYFDQQGGRSQLRLLVNGIPQGEPWQAAADDNAWKTHTIAGVKVKRSNEISVEVRGDGAELGKLDYVELRYQGAQ